MKLANYKILLAVYGTLRNRYANHEFYIKDALEDGRAKFIGKGKTLDKYTMYCAGIPFVIEDEPTSNIVVEVYEIRDEDVMRRIDMLEGHPEWYRRKLVPVVLDNGEVIDAWMYFYVSGDLRDSGLVKVVSGDYKDYVW